MSSFDEPLVALVRPLFVLVDRALCAVMPPAAAQCVVLGLLMWAAYTVAKAAGLKKWAARMPIIVLCAFAIGKFVGHG